MWASKLRARFAVDFGLLAHNLTSTLAVPLNYCEKFYPDRYNIFKRNTATDAGMRNVKLIPLIFFSIPGKWPWNQNFRVS